MENNEVSKSNKIKIIVITALIFLVSIAGISYAYFTIQIVGNDTASSMRLRTANMSLVYNDVQIVSGEYAEPGWTQTKTLTVTNNGNVNADYTIKFRELVNTIINGELVLSATCSASTGSCSNLPERAVHSASTEITDAYMYGPITIAPGVTHTYTVTALFKETGSNQNYNQNKYFNGTLNIGDGTATDESCFTTEEIDSTTVRISAYTCSYTDIVIPSTINNKTVTEIKDGPYYGYHTTGVFGNSGLTSVVLPNTLTKIGSSAFGYDEYASGSATQLTSIIIPSSVTSIGDAAFYNNQLTLVEIPSSVTSIGNAAFRNNQLKSVVIPSSVTTIDFQAFWHNQLTSVVISNSVTSIGMGAFQYNQLTSVVIPSSVTTIVASAFLDNQLTSVTIEGKSSSSEFATYGTAIWGWASGSGCSDATCITWLGSGS